MNTIISAAARAGDLRLANQVLRQALQLGGLTSKPVQTAGCDRTLSLAGGSHGKHLLSISIFKTIGFLEDRLAQGVCL